MREQHVAEFATTVAGLLTLSDWFSAFGVTQVVMEATGVYWKPVWVVLEDSFECVLVNARHVKQVPGPKTDVKDAEWLCQLAIHLVKTSLQPAVSTLNTARITAKWCIQGENSSEVPSGFRS